jgi:transcriptional regulator NrdR family protein
MVAVKNTGVIKHCGARPTEAFDRIKLHTSIRAACLSVRSPEGEAETIAEHVAKNVDSWCGERSAVTSDDIRRVATRSLEIFHPDAAYLYKNHQFIA